MAEGKALLPLLQCPSPPFQRDIALCALSIASIIPDEKIPPPRISLQPTTETRALPGPDEMGRGT